jgi:hypothetical protein
MCYYLCWWGVLVGVLLTSTLFHPLAAHPNARYECRLRVSNPGRHLGGSKQPLIHPADAALSPLRPTFGPKNVTFAHFFLWGGASFRGQNRGCFARRSRLRSLHFVSLAARARLPPPLALLRASRFLHTCVWSEARPTRPRGRAAVAAPLPRVTGLLLWLAALLPCVGGSWPRCGRSRFLPSPDARLASLARLAGIPPRPSFPPAAAVWP